MITISYYTPEMGSKQNPVCPVRHLVRIISDYIWVAPYSLSTTAYRDDRWCSFAVLYFVILCLMLVSICGAPIL